MHHCASCRDGHQALLIEQHPYTVPGELSSIACIWLLDSRLGRQHPSQILYVDTRGNSQVMQGIGDYRHLLLRPVLSSTAGDTEVLSIQNSLPVPALMQIRHLSR